MKTLSCVAWLSVLVSQLIAQTNEPIDSIKTSTFRRGSHPESALVDAQDKVFPQVVFGNGWETVVVVVNIGNTPIHYSQQFFDSNGNALQVTFKTIPGGNLVTGSATDSFLPPGASFNFSLFDSGGPLQSGWSRLVYDSTLGRLAGYVLIRHQATSGAFNFEATVPLSNLQDFAFYMPIDNIQGFSTYLTLVNPSNKTANVTLTFISLSDGSILFVDGGPLGPGLQLTLSIPDTYPTLANTLATVFVQADISLFSAMGLRLNPNTGAVASVPIMNWSGMFQ